MRLHLRASAAATLGAGLALLSSCKGSNELVAPLTATATPAAAATMTPTVTVTATATRTPAAAASATPPPTSIPHPTVTAAPVAAPEISGPWIGTVASFECGPAPVHFSVAQTGAAFAFTPGGPCRTGGVVEGTLGAFDHVHGVTVSGGRAGNLTGYASPVHLHIVIAEDDDRTIIDAGR